MKKPISFILTLPSQILGSQASTENLSLVLGQYGIKVINFYDEFNTMSSKFYTEGVKVKTLITIFSNKEYKICILKPSIPYLILSLFYKKTCITTFDIYKISLLVVSPMIRQNYKFYDYILYNMYKSIICTLKSMQIFPNTIYNLNDRKIGIINTEYYSIYKVILLEKFNLTARRGSFIFLKYRQNFYI